MTLEPRPGLPNTREDDTELPSKGNQGVIAVRTEGVAVGQNAVTNGDGGG